MSAPDDSAEPSIQGALLRHRGFLCVWTAGILNGVMRWLELLVVGLYVFQQTGSPFLAASMAILRLLPMALCGPWLGALADSLGRRRLYLALTAMGLAATGAQAVLAALDLIEVWHLAVGCFLSGIFWSGDVSVRRILLGEIAGPGRVAQGIAYDSLSNNVTRMLGPLLGGGLLQLFGLTGTFLLGFGCCLAIALLLLAVRDPAQPATGGTLRVGANLVAGIRLARASPLVIGLLLVTVIFNLFSFPTSSMVPVVGEGLLALSPLWVGLLAACEGAGATVGSLAIALFARAGWYRRIYWGGLTLAMLSIQVFAQADWAPLAGLALFVMGIGVAGFSSMQTTLVFLSVPPQARSRVMGLVSFCIGTAPLGLLLVGWLAGELGPGTALTVLSGAGLVALGLVLWRWREVR